MIMNITQSLRWLRQQSEIPLIYQRKKYRMCFGNAIDKLKRSGIDADYLKLLEQGIN